MSSGAIQDWQIAASSYFTGFDRGANGLGGGDMADIGGGGGGANLAGSNPHLASSGACQPKHARLYQSGSRAWCAKHRAAGEWILVDLGVVSQVVNVSSATPYDSRQLSRFFLLFFRWPAS